MNDFNALPIRDWYALGSLLAQLAFLVAGLWFARNFLQAIRAFQEQIGALLKLTITAAPGERQSASTFAKGVAAEASPYWLPPAQTMPADPPVLTEPGPNLFAIGWQRMVDWLREPMSTSHVSYGRRVMNWLQAPVGH